jgi:hypothetical protein
LTESTEKATGTEAPPEAAPLADDDDVQGELGDEELGSAGPDPDDTETEKEA